MKAGQGGPEVFEDASREPQMSPRSAPGAPRSEPRGAKTAPRRARSRPRAPQEPAKRRKKGAKKITMFGSGLGMASGRPPGAILASFSSLRGPIFQPPESNFGGFFRALCGHVLCSEVRRSARNFNARHVPSLFLAAFSACLVLHVGNAPSSKR